MGAESGSVRSCLRDRGKLVPLTPAERVDLIAKLDDTQARDLLLHYLEQGNPTNPAPKTAEGLFSEFEQRVEMRAECSRRASQRCGSARCTNHCRRKTQRRRGFLGLCYRSDRACAVDRRGSPVEGLYAFGVRQSVKIFGSQPAEGRGVAADHIRAHTSGPLRHPFVCCRIRVGLLGSLARQPGEA